MLQRECPKWNKEVNSGIQRGGCNTEEYQATNQNHNYWLLFACLVYLHAKMPGRTRTNGSILWINEDWMAGNLSGLCQHSETRVRAVSRMGLPKTSDELHWVYYFGICPHPTITSMLPRSPVSECNFPTRPGIHAFCSPSCHTHAMPANTISSAHFLPNQIPSSILVL